jgi:four helix bundle protein
MKQQAQFCRSVAWQEALCLIMRLERMMRSCPPGLRRQLQERALSVATGIALGHRLPEWGQAKQGLRQAKWALMEIEALLVLGEEFRYWQAAQLQPLREQLERMHRYLTQLGDRLASNQ